MKFNCGPSKEERIAEWYLQCKREANALRIWHDYFCWWPVRIAKGDCRWLETVERRYDSAVVLGYKHAHIRCYDPQYRAKDSNSNYSGLAPA